MFYWDHTLVYSCTLLHLLKRKDYQNYAIYFPNTHTHTYIQSCIYRKSLLPTVYVPVMWYTWQESIHTHTLIQIHKHTYTHTHTFSRFIENVNIPLHPFILLNCVEFTQKYHLSHTYKHKVCWLAAHTCTPAVVLLVVNWHLFKIVCVCEFVCFDTELDPYDL